MNKYELKGDWMERRRVIKKADPTPGDRLHFPLLSSTTDFRLAPASAIFEIEIETNGLNPSKYMVTNRYTFVNYHLKATPCNDSCITVNYYYYFSLYMNI